MNYYQEIKEQLVNNEICQKDNYFVMEYYSYPRIYRTTYQMN